MMRSFLLILMMGLGFHQLFAQAPNWGTADTLEHHKIGPGIQFTKIYFTGKKMLVWVTAIDMNNPYNKVQQAQSRNQVPDVLRWRPETFYQENSRPGHKVCAAFNHDFFSYDHGICIGLNVSEGEIPYGSGSGRSLLTITKEKEAGVIYPVLNANVILPDNSQVKIDFFNSNALGLTGNCILFNRFNSITLTEAGKYIRIKPEEAWTVNGADIPCLVTEISDTPLQTSATEYVIYLRGTKINAFDGRVKSGDRIMISQKFTTGKFGLPMADIMNGFHGYPSLAFNGQLHQGEYNDFENGREYEISSRQMAGMSQDGKTIFIVTTEMSSTSAGVNCIDLANYMLSIGAWNVVNFDSGGSVAIVVDNKMLNYPARDAVRPVEDALLAISTAPESATIHKYAFNRSSINPTIVSLVPISLLAYNQYEEVLARNVKGFTFRCEPENLGYVDENYIFHAGPESITGKIIASKEGKETELIVRIQPASEITLTHPRIIIDRKRGYPINMTCKVGSATYPMDPSAFQWTIENPAVCEVVNGVLRGLSNGETTITGRLNSIERTMQVSVQIGLNGLVCESFNDMTGFTTSSSGVSNINFGNSGLPAQWDSGVNMGINYSGGRLPFIELRKEINLYGLPDSLTLDFQTANQSLLKEIQFFIVKENNSTYKTIILTSKAVEKQTFSVPFSTDGVPWNMTDFPLKISKMKLVLNPGQPVQLYNLFLRNLTTHYPERTESGISPIQKEREFHFLAQMEGKQLTIGYELMQQNEISIRIVGMNGSVVINEVPEYLPVGSYTKQIDLQSLSSGIYLIQMGVGDQPYSQKIAIE